MLVRLRIMTRYKRQPQLLPLRKIPVLLPIDTRRNNRSRLTIPDVSNVNDSVSDY